MTWAVDPLSATKLLPPLLGLVAALFTFLFVRRLRSSPPAALLAAVLGVGLLGRGSRGTAAGVRFCHGGRTC